MSKKGIYILLVFISCASHAQQGKIDSLLDVIKNEKEDTARVKQLTSLANECQSLGYFSMGLLYAERAIILAEKTNFRNGIANASNSMGNIYYAQGDYTKAFDSYLKALKIDEQLNNRKKVGAHLGNLGLIYFELRNYDKVLEYCNKSLEIAREFGNKQLITTNLGNIGNVYYNKAEQLRKENKDTASANSNYEIALEYYFKALKFAEDQADFSGVVVWLSNIGVVYYSKNDFDRAMDYFLQTLEISKKIGDKNEITIVLGNLGELCITAKKYDQAEKFLRDAMLINKEVGNKKQEMLQEEQLSILYEKTNRPAEALEHYKKAMLLKDSLWDQEKSSDITRKEVDYEYEKKEFAARAEQEKKDAITKIIIYSVSIGFILVMLLASFIFRSLRIRNKQNKIITEQKVEIEKAFQNLELLNNISTEITSSLNLESVMEKIYKNISSLMNVSFFIISTYDESDETVEIKYCVKQNSVVKEEFVTSILNPDSYTAWTVKNKKEIIMMNESIERSKYLKGPRVLHGKQDIFTETIIFIPLLVKDKVIGSFSVQSVYKNAYSEYDINILRSLSSVIAVALKNADSYNKLNKANIEIKNQKQIVEDKQKEILDSIRYAKRIQYSLLPTVKYIERKLKELKK